MRSLVVVLASLVFGFVTGCSRGAVPLPDSTSRGGDQYVASLGTEWGEHVESRVEYVSFQRSQERRPDAIASIHYDSRWKIKQLTGDRSMRTRPFVLPGVDLEVGLTDEEHSLFSGYLPGVERNGGYFVSGERGDRYAIFLKNRSRERVEVVLSVDGVDVMNGREASFSNRGYVIEPGASFKVEGFRDSQSSVAAFRFAAAGDSYVTQKTGSSRNIGVIGVAVFQEQNAYRYAPWATPRQRDGANPFPGEFATPPQ